MTVLTGTPFSPSIASSACGSCPSASSLYCSPPDQTVVFSVYHPDISFRDLIEKVVLDSEVQLASPISLNQDCFPSRLCRPILWTWERSVGEVWHLQVWK